MNGKILLIEDEASLNRAVSLKLIKEGYDVYSASTIKEARDLYSVHNTDLIICDIGLPDGSGLDFCTDIRKQDKATTFLFLTAMDTEMDMIRGYSAGANDYITKPFSLIVLVMKVNAIMERCKMDGVKTSDSEDRKKIILRSEDIELFADEKRVKKNGMSLNLTATEYKLLEFFMRNSMKVLSKNQLLEAVWDIDGSFVDDNTVAVNIRRLRAKIEDDPSAPSAIKNIRGLGYIWERECEEL